MRFVHVDGRTDEFSLEANDCTVRAVSVAAQMPYAVAHEELRRAGRKDRKGFSTSLFIAFKKHKLCNYKVEPREVPRPNTVATTLARYRRGRYLIRVTGHVFAVVDGVVYDRFVSSGGRCRVKGIFELIAQ